MAPIKKIANNARVNGIGCDGMEICARTQRMAVNIPVKTRLPVVIFDLMILDSILIHVQVCLAGGPVLFLSLFLVRITLVIILCQLLSDTYFTAGQCLFFPIGIFHDEPCFIVYPDCGCRNLFCSFQDEDFFAN